MQGICVDRQLPAHHLARQFTRQIQHAPGHHLLGIRHLVLDTGAGYELKANKTYAMLTMVASVALTAIFWLWMGTH